MPSPSKKQTHPHLSLVANNSDDYLKLSDDGAINNGFQATTTPETATTNIADSPDFISVSTNTVNTNPTSNDDDDEFILRNNAKNELNVRPLSKHNSNKQTKNNNNNNNNNTNHNNTPYYISNNGVPHGQYRYTLPLSLAVPLPQPLAPSIPQQQQQLQKDSQQHQAQDDKFRLYTIYGNDTDNDKLSGLPQSTTGSLSSIITTSIASSEPDPGTGGGRGSSGGGGGGGGGAGGGGSSIGALDASSIAGVPGSSDEKLALNRPGIKQEKWSSILLQVSIPFFLAGVGTIGAGIILGRVE
ncbi:PREDICTED: uncharacterized protein DDB_G0288805-like, partial [Rhagoletis zephyria]|uniref:uncharacterized protein DDB_G0288805-like n=1 Tax=Rhagoletis zephyria TaxID=28612 RepID=UPI0008113091